MEKGEKVLGALIRETCQNVYKIETVFFHLKIGLSTVPELRSRYGKLDRYTKLRYTKVVFMREFPQKNVAECLFRYILQIHFFVNW